LWTAQCLRVHHKNRRRKRVTTITDFIVARKTKKFVQQTLENDRIFLKIQMKYITVEKKKNNVPITIRLFFMYVKIYIRAISR